MERGIQESTFGLFSCLSMGLGLGLEVHKVARLGGLIRTSNDILGAGFGFGFGFGFENDHDSKEIIFKISKFMWLRGV